VVREVGTTGRQRTGRGERQRERFELVLIAIPAGGDFTSQLPARREVDQIRGWENLNFARRAAAGVGNGDVRRAGWQEPLKEDLPVRDAQ
jgi:hypothetical protein